MNISPSIEKYIEEQNEIFDWYNYAEYSNMNRFNPVGIDWNERLKFIMGILN